MRNSYLHILLTFFTLIATYTTIAQTNRYKIQYKGTRNSDCIIGVTYDIVLDEDGFNPAGTNPNQFPINVEHILTVSNNASAGNTYDIDRVITTNRNYEFVRKYSEGTSSNCFSQDFTPPYFARIFECTSAPVGFQWNGVDWEHRIAYKIETLEEYNNVPSTGLSLPDCEQLRVQFATLCASKYLVEYQIGNNTSTWSTFLPYAQRANAVNLNFSDFPGLDVGENVRLRVRYNNAAPFEYSDILTLNTVKCSPKITSISTIDTTCSYSNDGGFTITFDRPLDSGEMLTNIGIYIDNGDGIVDTSTTNDPLDQPTPNFATYNGTTFTYPEVLPAGDYFFSYQTDNQNSAEISVLFTIESPPPLEYEVKIASEISCFEENDGSVKIDIDPQNSGSIGSGNYYYTLGNTTTQHTFTGTTTIVNNLGTTTIIKVFDGEGCTQRQ